MFAKHQAEYTVHNITRIFERPTQAQAVIFLLAPLTPPPNIHFQDVLECTDVSQNKTTPKTFPDLPGVVQVAHLHPVAATHSWLWC